MIECVFTIDYEIYGNGTGSLEDLVYAPTRRLLEVFDRHGAKMVNFVEVAEFAQIERHSADPASGKVRRQIREMYQNGHEIALHLHPQWANARRRGDSWELDYSEYNLCTLDPKRIHQIVTAARDWLQDVVESVDFRPVSFRAGNWLFQPTRNAANVLAEHGIRIDSSVFKGGLQHHHRLDYRPAGKLGWWWRFDDDVVKPAADGRFLELPIYSEMVPFWRMLTGKRVALQRKMAGPGPSVPGRPGRLTRLRDFLRPRYPLKFDFCRMTFGEMTSMVERVLARDADDPGTVKPMVAIGHSKDLVDFDAIDAFLGWLTRRGIAISTLDSVAGNCRSRLVTA